MALIRHGYRPFSRKRDRITIFLQMEDWPEDVPLPEGVGIMETGDGPLPPSWTIYFKPDKTVELVAGWFRMKRRLEEVFAWYTNAMKSQGWLEETRHETYPRSAYLLYRHPETDVKVEISFYFNPHLDETRPFIRRATITPYTPPETEAGSEAESETATSRVTAWY